MCEYTLTVLIKIIYEFPLCLRQWNNFIIENIRKESCAVYADSENTGIFVGLANIWGSREIKASILWNEFPHRKTGQIIYYVSRAGKSAIEILAEREQM